MEVVMFTVPPLVLMHLKCVLCWPAFSPVMKLLCPLILRFYSLAFVRQGARIVFADSRMDNPCIDEQKLEALVTPRTRAIVPVHYAGIACDMDVILAVPNAIICW